MSKIIIDLLSSAVVATTTDIDHQPQVGQLMLDAPEGFDIIDAAEWVFDGAAVKRDPSAALEHAQAARKKRIKQEAACLIESTDWKLQRAKEREAASFGTVADVNAVLAERESIRQSSNVAESAVDALTDVQSVTAFTWSVSATVSVPRLLTHRQFMIRFSNTELQALLTAVDGSIAVRAWWEQYQAAEYVNLDDPGTQGGLQALESAGILSAGRSTEILA